MMSENALIHLLTDRIRELEAELTETQRTSEMSRFIVRPDGKYEFIHNWETMRGDLDAVIIEIDDSEESPEPMTRMCIGDLDPHVVEIIYTCSKRTHAFEHSPIPSPETPVKCIMLYDGNGPLSISLNGPIEPWAYILIDNRTLITIPIDVSMVNPLIEYAYVHGTLEIASTRD